MLNSKPVSGGSLGRIICIAIPLGLGCASDQGAGTAGSVNVYKIAAELRPTTRSIIVDATLTTHSQAGTLQLALAGHFRVDSLAVNNTSTWTERRGDTLRIAVGQGRNAIRLIGELHFSPEEVFAGCDSAEAYAIASTGWYPIRYDSWFGRGSLEFRLPAGWSVVANGVRVSEESVGEVIVSRWEISRPTLFGFRAGPTVTHVTRVNDIPFYYQCTKDRAVCNVFRERTAQVLGYYTESFGGYPYESFAVAPVLASDFEDRGGTAQWGLTLWADAFFVADPYLFVIPHEVAHMWWGVSVVPDDSAFNLWAEGLAEYATALYFRATEGEESFQENLWRGNHKDRFCIEAYIRDWSWRDMPITTGNHALQDIAKTKGKYFLWLLHQTVGDAAWYGALRDVYARYGGTDHRVSTADFRRVFETHAGRDLTTLFHEWLDRPGIPDLQLEFLVRAQSGVSGKAVDVSIHQRGDTYHLDVPVRLYGAFEPMDASVRIGDRSTDTTFLVPGVVDSVILDPGLTILRWTPQWRELAAQGRARQLGLEDEK